MNKLKLQNDAELKVNPIRLSTNLKFECFRISSDFWFDKYEDRDSSTYYYGWVKTEKYIITLKCNTSDNVICKWFLEYRKITGTKIFKKSFSTDLEVAVFINTELK
jgi:hypothetical protein